jgi:hypothetical protein
MKVGNSPSPCYRLTMPPHTRSAQLAALTLALLVGSPAVAAPTSATAAPSAPSLPLSGRVFSDIYVPATNTGTSGYRQDSASLWLQGDPRLGENGSARFILTGDAIQNNSVSAVGNSGAQFRVGLREGWVSYAKNGGEFRLGQQIIPWGKSDVVNPTDFLSAKNYTIFNPDDEVRRVGAVSLLLDWTPAQGNSPLTFTLVMTPIFAQTQLLVPPESVPSGITIVPTATLPPQTIANTETALKVSYAANRWDASLSVFRGFNHLPEFALLSSSGGTTTTPPTTFTVGQTFHSLRAAGADFSFTLGKWIVRGESAYVWTENSSGRNPLIQPSHWDAVAGGERPLGDDWRLQAQFVYRVYPHWSPATRASGPDPVTEQVNQGIARINALLLNYQETDRPAATFRLSYANESNGLEAEIFALVNFVGGDFSYNPRPPTTGRMRCSRPQALPGTAARKTDLWGRSGPLTRSLSKASTASNQKVVTTFWFNVASRDPESVDGSGRKNSSPG